jgi:hypothetical protein
MDRLRCLVRASGSFHPARRESGKEPLSAGSTSDTIPAITVRQSATGPPLTRPRVPESDGNLPDARRPARENTVCQQWLFQLIALSGESLVVEISVGRSLNLSPVSCFRQSSTWLKNCSRWLRGGSFAVVFDWPMSFATSSTKRTI